MLNIVIVMLIGLFNNVINLVLLLIVNGLSRRFTENSLFRQVINIMNVKRSRPNKDIMDLLFDFTVNGYVILLVIIVVYPHLYNNSIHK